MRRLRRAALFVLCCAACRDRLEVDLQRASDLFYQRQYQAAEQLYATTLTELRQAVATPRRRAQIVQAQSRLGSLHALYLRDYGRAVADYEGLSQLAGGTPTGLQALQALGDLYATKLQDLPAAIGAYERLVAEFSEHPAARKAQLAVVRAAMRLQDYPAARRAAATLRRRYPDSREAALARLASAFCLSLEGALPQAIAALDELAEAPLEAPQHALVEVERAACYQKLGQPQRALRHLLAALPAHPQPRLVQEKIARLRAATHP